MPASDPTSDREHNKATARVLRVLSAFVGNTEDFGVTELNQRLGMTKNMVHRALTTLVEQGYLVRKAATGRYELGFRILELQNFNQAEPDFRTLASPFMRQIYELTGESVSLAVRAQDFSVFIDAVETRKLGAWRTRIGALRPLHATTSGRVLLASLQDDDINAYAERRSPMRLSRPDGVMKAPDLWRAVHAIRQRGYEIARRGVNPVMAAVAFPIEDSEGGLHGVIAVGGPEDRFDPDSNAIMPPLRALVDELRARTKLYASETAGQ
ncbi:IclR family transcriptional regulator [Terricaulis silvestris]|uniref:Kip operon repressor protein n=1 Tax=Terricaulis silvestris TaxID=2686094 RepID=A0A6I6MRC0_9CAUL|nr:IclR family transcriptional regulator [Terricaulis silvestris]QGZ93683.1 Kip operon repressor protein [Terricaulis silvestris]